MGLAKIIAHEKDSQYTIQYEQDTELAESRLEILKAKLPDLYSEKPKINEKIQEKYIEIGALNESQNALNEDDYANRIEYLTAINLIAVDIGKKNKEIKLLEQHLSVLDIQISQVDDEIGAIKSAIKDLTPFSAWCADFYEDLKAGDEVTTLEINDEWNGFNKEVLILPQTFRAKKENITLWSKLSEKIQLDIDVVNDEITAIQENIQDLREEQVEKQAEIDQKTQEIIDHLSLASVDDGYVAGLQSQLKTLVLELEIIIAEIFSKTEYSEQLLTRRDDIEVHKKVIDDEKIAFETSAAINEDYPLSGYNSTEIKAVISTETGIFQPFISTENWTYFFNVIALSTLQKWTPIYRKGRITTISYNDELCTVKLEHDGQQDNSAIVANDNDYLNINQGLALENVPIFYGHGYGFYAFEVDDVVVIDFNKDFYFPVVIGFFEEPKKMPWFLVEDLEDRRSILEYGHRENPENIELWEVQLKIIDENPLLIDLMKNYEDYSVDFGVDAEEFSKISDNQLIAQLYDLQGSISSSPLESWYHLYRVSLNWRDDIDKETVCILSLSLRSKVSIIYSDPFSPEVPFFASFAIKKGDENVMSVDIEVKKDDKVIVITNNKSTRLANKKDIDGEFISINVL